MSVSATYAARCRKVVDGQTKSLTPHRVQWDPRRRLNSLRGRKPGAERKARANTLRRRVAVRRGAECGKLLRKICRENGEDDADELLAQPLGGRAAVISIHMNRRDHPYH